MWEVGATITTTGWVVTNTQKLIVEQIHQSSKAVCNLVYETDHADLPKPEQSH
jgi:hypothetical protein